MLLATRAKTETEHYDHRKWTLDKNEVVNRRSYFNETVEIDGKTFDHCSFSNVTFVYHGLANTTFLEPQINGNTFLKTDNQAAKGILILESFLRSQQGVSSFMLGEIDPSSGKVRTIETLKKTDTPKPKQQP